MLFTAENLAHQPWQIRIDHGFAAADGNNGRSAFIHRRQALLNRQLILDRGLIFADTTAAGTGEVACVQRLKHHPKRKSHKGFSPTWFLPRAPWFGAFRSNSKETIISSLNSSLPCLGPFRQPAPVLDLPV